MERNNKLIIKETIANVNRTLNYYEKDFISVQRSPWTDKERCQSFEQYIEARFNYEMSKIPEFEYLCKVFEGRLFSLREITEIDDELRKFKLATFDLPAEETVKEVLTPFPEMEPLIYDEMTKIIKYLGGKTIKFNNVRKKIKIIVEK